MSGGLTLWWLTMAGNRARTEWLAAHDEPPAMLADLTVDPMQPAIDALERCLIAYGLLEKANQDAASEEGRTGKP